MKEIVEEITKYLLYSQVEEQKSLFDLYLKDHEYTEVTVLPFDRYQKVYNQEFISLDSTVRFIPQWEKLAINKCYSLRELKFLRNKNIELKEDNYLRYLVNNDLAQMIYSIAKEIIHNRSLNYYTKILLPDTGIFNNRIEELDRLIIVGLIKVCFSDIDFESRYLGL